MCESIVEAYFVAYLRGCPGLVDGNVTDPRLRHARVRGTVVSW